MAGKLGSKDFALLLVDGYDFLASKLQGFSRKVTSGMEKTTGLGDSTEAQAPTGVSTLTITQSGGFFDDTAARVHALLATIANLQVSRVLLAAFGGNTAGAHCLGASGVYGMEYEVVAQVGSLTKANVTYNVSGSIDRGVLLQPSAAQTVDWNGTAHDYTTDTAQVVIPITSATKANPCVVTTTVPHGLTTGQKVLISGNTLSTPNINADLAVTVISTTTFSVATDTSASTGAGTGGSLVLSSTVTGAAGIHEITAFSGFTGFVGKIQHSADNSTWADLITFTNQTGAQVAERVTASGTVNRYTRYVGDVTGTGSITVAAMVARL